MFKKPDAEPTFNAMYDIYNAKRKSMLANPSSTSEEIDIFQDALKKTNLSSLQQKAMLFLYKSLIFIDKSVLINLRALDEQLFFELTQSIPLVVAHKLIRLRPPEKLSLPLVTKVYKDLLSNEVQLVLDRDGLDIMALGKVLKNNPLPLTSEQAEIIQSIEDGEERRKRYLILHFLYQANLFNDTSFKETMNLHEHNISSLFSFLRKIDCTHLTLETWNIFAKTLQQDVFMYPLGMLIKRMLDYKLLLDKNNVTSCIKIWNHIRFDMGCVNELETPLIKILHAKGLLTNENLQILEKLDSKFCDVFRYLSYHNILTQKRFSEGSKWRDIFAQEEIKMSLYDLSDNDPNLHRHAFDFLVQEAELEKDLPSLTIKFKNKLSELLQTPNLPFTDTVAQPCVEEHKITMSQKIDYYEVAELIYKQYLKHGIEINTSSSDILEYMVLEYAGVLKEVQGFPLKCSTLPDYTLNLMFNDNKPRSTIEFYFETPLVQEEEKLNGVINKIAKATASTLMHKDYYSSTQRSLRSRPCIFIPHEEIINALYSSSLLKASGDLSKLSLEELTGLKQQVELYDLSDAKISSLVEKIVQQINHAISEISNLQQAKNRIDFAEKECTENIAIPLFRSSFFSNASNPEAKDSTKCLQANPSAI